MSIFPAVNKLLGYHNLMDYTLIPYIIIAVRPKPHGLILSIEFLLGAHEY